MGYFMEKKSKNEDSRERKDDKIYMWEIHLCKKMRKK
jgi:hypothetical protein